MNQLQFLKVLSRLYESHTEADRQWLLKYFDDPNNIEHFALIFGDHILSPTPDFHRSLIKLFTQTTGHKAAAAPRGFAKSTVTDLVVTMWYACTGRKHMIVIISDTSSQAELFLGTIRSEVEENDILKWLYPGLQGLRWNNEDIVLNTFSIHSGATQCRIVARGAGKKIRGLKFKNWRPDLIIIDDLENDEAVESDDQRQKLYNWFTKSVIPSLAKHGDKIAGEIIMIGTILHTESLLSKIVNKKGVFSSWSTLFFQALTNGISLWPDKWSTRELIRMRDDPRYEYYVGSIVFAQEMQNDPLEDGQRIIKPQWCEQHFTMADLKNEFLNGGGDPEELEGAYWIRKLFKRLVMAVDPAISEEQTADYFAMILSGIREDGHIFVLDYFNDRLGDPLAQVDAILDWVSVWWPDSVKIEAVAYQKGLANLVKKIGAQKQVYPPVQPVRPDKDKVRRAKIHAANFSGNLVHLRKDHVLFNDFYEQVIQFPLMKHDDMFDAYMNTTEETIIRPRARGFTNRAEGF